MCLPNQFCIMKQLQITEFSTGKKLQLDRENPENLKTKFELGSCLIYGTLVGIVLNSFFYSSSVYGSCCSGLHIF